MRYYLDIDYEEYNPKSYKGVIIGSYENDERKELVRVNTGSPQLDEKKALLQLYDLVGEVTVYYMSSYDSYFQDLDYENDPEYKADVDKIMKELEMEDH